MAAETKKPFSRVSRQTVFECPYYNIEHDQYILPNGEEGDYFIVRRGPSIFVIPQDADGNFLMTEQFRYIIQKSDIEFSGGGVDDGEDPKQAAQRELKEELGITAANWAKIAEFTPFNGVSNETCHLLLAQDLTFGESAEDPEEDIKMHKYTSEEIDLMIKDGTIFDGMTIAAWQLYKLHYD